MSSRQMFRDYPIRSAADFYKLPGYVDDIDHTKEEFEDVLSHHYFSVMARCSIQKCHRQYNSGYLILWKSGSISNIGHICGRKHIGDRYAVRLDHYQTEVLLPRLQEQLRAFKAATPQYFAHATKLIATAKELAVKKAAFKKQYQLIYDELSTRSRSGSYEVHRTKEILEPELDENGLPTGRQKKRYETLALGKIYGLEFLAQHVMPLFTDSITPTLERLENSDVRSLSIRVASELFNEASALDERFSEATRLLRSGADLFSSQAESLIRQIQGNRALEAECRRYTLTVLEQCTVASKTEAAANKKSPPKSRRQGGWSR